MPTISHKMQRVYFAVLLSITYLLIGWFVLSPNYAWVHPEINAYDRFTLTDPSSALAKTFNWEEYEFVPRQTRPISNFFTIVEGQFRHAIHGTILPYIPSFSPLVFTLCLLLTPLLAFYLLGLLGMPFEIRAAGYLLTLVTPAALSHVGLFFRPSKALSEFFLMLAAVWIVRMVAKPKSSRLEQVALGLILLFGFLSDEYGSLGYAAVVFVAFPQMWKRRREFLPVLTVVPLLLGFLYFWLFPRLSEWLWDLHGNTGDYYIFDKLLDGDDKLHALYLLLEKFFWFIFDHTWIFFGETLGFVIGAMPPGAGALFPIVSIICVILVFGFAARKLLVKQDRDANRSKWILATRFVLLYFVAIAFHSLLMSLVVGPAGPFYYGGAACIFLVMLFVVLLNWFPAGYRLLVITPIVLSNIYITVFTMQAHKKFHHYPYSHDFIKMYLGDINRFTLEGKRKTFPLQEMLAARWMKSGDCRAIPMELTWYLTTGGFIVEKELAKNVPATPELCRYSSCCEGPDIPTCTVRCGHF